MSSEDIIAIIKWGPLILFLIIFLMGMFSGMAKGRRKTIRRLIYVIIYVSLIFIFTPKISELVMQIQIEGTTIEGHINTFIENNESIQKVFDDVPGLESIITTYPVAIVSLVLFIVLIFVGLPLSFPIYLVYLAIYAIIARCVFKFSRYKRDENGKIVRNSKGKKIKIKRKKHRLTAGLIKGMESVALASTILVPVGVITRLYQDGKENAIDNDLSNIEALEKHKDILMYIDAFNDSIIGKITNSNINKAIGGYLTPIVIDGDKTTMENELSNIVVAAVHLEQSGLIKLLSGNIDIKTLDLSKLDLQRIEIAIEMLFKSTTLKSIVTDGVNYVLENNLKNTLIDFTGDGDIISKIKYNNAEEIKAELLRVTDILKTIINAKILDAYQANSDNLVGVINNVTTSDVETILNKVLSIQILSKSMPGVIQKLLKDQGLVSTLTSEDNSDIVRLLVDVVAFVKTMEIQKLEDISDGNVFDNLLNSLYKEGAIKDNSKEAISTLLSNINSSRVFSEVLTYQLNQLLEKYEITLNAEMLTKVNTTEDWDKELLVLENIFDLYDQYQENQTIEFLTANELIKNLKNSKAMILAVPIAYQKLFPNIGIEVDSSKIEYIDYSQPGADEQEVKFYNYWRAQLVHFENISEELAKLQIKSISDISLDLLEIDANAKSIANIVAEVFSTDLLKDGVIELFNEHISKLLADYGVNLNYSAINSVNALIETEPYYITVGDVEYNVSYKDNNYYINETLVTIDNNTVIFNGESYQLEVNELSRVWNSEVKNLSNIVSAIKAGDYTNKDNLSVILNSVDDMELLKDVKVDLLMFAVNQIGLLTEEEYNEIDKSLLSFTKEKDILLNIIEEYDLLSDISNVDFKTINDTTIGSLANVLDSILDSYIFGDSVANNLVNIFNENDIKHDLDSSDSNSNLISAIKGVASWESELNNIKTLLNITTKDNITSEVFDAIEKQDGLLVGCRASLMVKMIKSVGDEELVVPTVNDLVKDNYAQYKIEKEVLLQASNIDLINASNVNDTNKTIIANALNAMSLSVVFETKYNNLVDDIGETITAKENVITIEENPIIDDWNDELGILIGIRDNVDSLDSITLETVDAKTVANVLDLIDSSNLITDGSSQAVANKVITTITQGNENSITKNGTWENTFEIKINELKGAVQ